MADNINRIMLKCLGHHDEGVADAAILPGEAVELAADGKYDPQASAQADALKGGLKIAIEDALQGKTVDDAYASADVLFFYSPLSGDVVHALVKTGEDIDVGDNLVVEGGGSGKFVEAAGTETKFQLEALEDSGKPRGCSKHPSGLKLQPERTSALLQREGRDLYHCQRKRQGKSRYRRQCNGHSPQGRMDSVGSSCREGGQASTPGGQRPEGRWT